MEAIVGIISTFGFAAFLVYLFFSTRNRERMALIESGKDAGIFKQTPGSYGALKWGLLLVFLGTGLGIGLFIDVTYDNDGPLATFPLVFIFGGLSLLLYYRLMKDKDYEV